MVYRYGQRIKRSRRSIKKYVAGIAASLVVATGAGGLALAAGNSEPGLDRYLANPGRQQATEVGAQCGVPGESGAGSGAFGYFGKDNNLAGGANGPATGDANSSLCGQGHN